MHVTLHLTARCNFRCRYCYAAPHLGGEMDWETARAALELAARTGATEHPGQSVGIIFFGGEPLLRRDLIERSIRHCDQLSARNGQTFYFKITTNGSLLDESFLTAADTGQVFVALSHDGVIAAHDTHRLDVEGAGTFQRLDSAIDLLLRHKPYAPALLVTTPQTVRHYAESVDYLYRRGFRYLICSLDYGADWSGAALSELRRQYRRLEDWYVELMRREQKFFFSPFETKISSHVNGGERGERCELGRRQISVAPSGRLFPCVQFVGDGGDSEFCIGDVQRGIDEERRAALYARNAEEKPECRECAIRMRCNHFCGCLNRQATGTLDEVSPLLCAHEQMTLAAADRVAGKLYRQRNALFIQKHYNELFPLVSLAEDHSQTSG